MKRAVVSLALAAAALAPLQSGVAAETATVSSAVVTVPLTVEEPRINLGEITAGTEAVATFVFHNRGENEVRILKAKPS